MHTDSTWRRLPIGAEPAPGGGVHFRVWAPKRQDVAVELEPAGTLVSLSAEPLAMHGDVIAVLDKIRLAKITKIGYQIKTASVQGAPGTVAPPGPAAAPPPPKKP